MLACCRNCHLQSLRTGSLFKCSTAIHLIAEVVDLVQIRGEFGAVFIVHRIARLRRFLQSLVVVQHLDVRIWTPGSPSARFLDHTWIVVLLYFSVRGTFPLPIQSFLNALLGLLLDFAPSRNLKTCPIKQCWMASGWPLICHMKAFCGNLSCCTRRSHALCRAEGAQTSCAFDLANGKVRPEAWVGSVGLLFGTSHILILGQTGGLLLHIHLLFQVVTQQGTLLFAHEIGSTCFLLLQTCPRVTSFVLWKWTPFVHFFLSSWFVVGRCSRRCRSFLFKASTALHETCRGFSAIFSATDRGTAF